MTASTPLPPNERLLLAIRSLLAAQHHVDVLHEDAARQRDAAKRGYIGANRANATITEERAKRRQGEIDAVIDVVLRSL